MSRRREERRRETQRRRRERAAAEEKQRETQRRGRERAAAEPRPPGPTGSSRRLALVGGAVLATAVLAVIVILVVAGGGHGPDGVGTPAGAASDVRLPARKITDLAAAARAAGCTLRSPPIEGRDHTDGRVSYRTNPPTSGDHAPQPAADGVYGAGQTPSPEHYVHSLEHGRIELQYRPGSPRRTIDTLVALFDEPLHGSPGYHALVFANNTGMRAAVAATAWGQMITCPALDDATIDALRAFRERYTDKGPELIP